MKRWREIQLLLLDGYSLQARIYDLSSMAVIISQPGKTGRMREITI